MKYIRPKTVVLAIIFSAVSAVSGYAENPVIRNCTWCHGAAAQGYTPAPRLAGQRSQYIETELMSFRGHLRDSPFSKQYMWGAAGHLGPETVRDLATYFAALPPRAANDGNSELFARGRAIYTDGIPEANIVSCVACHGPNGEGVGQIPRLGGLAYTYLKRRLAEWGEGYNAAAAPPMPRIAGTLSPDQVEALASYLSFVK